MWIPAFSKVGFIGSRLVGHAPVLATIGRYDLAAECSDANEARISISSIKINVADVVGVVRPCTGG
jgi:hypothetical protein